eukprot:g51764.t1
MYAPPKSVRCIELGKEFPSIKAAAEALGVNRGHIRRALQTGPSHKFDWNWGDKLVEEGGFGAVRDSCRVNSAGGEGGGVWLELKSGLQGEG